MRVLIVYAHPNPESFCHAILQQFTKGLEDAGHASEVVDLYAIRFDPVFRMRDFASYVHESIPLEILEQMNLKQRVMDSAGGPIRRFIASRWLRNKEIWQHPCCTGKSRTFLNQDNRNIYAFKQGAPELDYQGIRDESMHTFMHSHPDRGECSQAN